MENNNEVIANARVSMKSHLVPGEKIEADTLMMDVGCTMMQNFAPVKQIHQHACAIHCYDGDLQRQVIAHHYCSHVNEEVRQCVIYDSGEPTARLIGLEFIISERLFKTLPAEEKQFWHSHAFEVKSGLMVLPGVPEEVERKDMEKLANTYGKTWHVWQVDRGDALPLGPATLMMSFTAEGQADSNLIAEMDKLAGSNILDRRKAREAISANPPAAEADVGMKVNHLRSSHTHHAI